jgi:nucleolar protein 56
VELPLPDGTRSVHGFSRLGLIYPLFPLQPFESAEQALANINDISEGVLSEELGAFLEANLPSVKAKAGKSPKWHLGVSDPKIGNAIQEARGIPCNSNDTILEVARGIRLHFGHYVEGLAGGALEKSQLGLAHSYSRAKVKFNVNRSDNMIIQAIALLDSLDKDLNTFAMRVREWYGWHFPELARIVKDNYVYARVAKFIGSRSTFTAEKVADLQALLVGVDDAETVANAIFEASRTSMGMDISETDLANVDSFTGESPYYA